MSIPFFPCIRRLLHIAGLTLLAAPMGPATAVAQSTQALQAGDTVRFLPRDSNRRIQGQVVQSTYDGLRIDVGGEVREIAEVDMRELELRSGTRRLTKRGAAIGFAAGVALGILSINAEDRDPDEWQIVSASDLAVVLVPLSAVTGALVGALFGTLHHTDRWVTVAPMIGTAAGGTVSGVAISLSF